MAVNLFDVGYTRKYFRVFWGFGKVMRIEPDTINILDTLNKTDVFTDFIYCNDFDVILRVRVNENNNNNNFDKKILARIFIWMFQIGLKGHWIIAPLASSLSRLD